MIFICHDFYIVISHHNIRIKGLFKNISIISAYAPSEDTEDGIKGAFYDLIEKEWRNLPAYDIKLLMGDFNAKVGKEQIWRKVARLNSLHTDSNDNRVRLLSLADNRVRLLSLATACDLKVISTHFSRKGIHKVTRVSPNGQVGNQIDQDLIDHTRTSHTQNVHSIRKAECGSDHSIELVNLYQRIKLEKNKVMQTAENVEIDKLKYKRILTEFRQKLSGCFEVLEIVEPEGGLEDTVKNGWIVIKNTTQNCVKEVCGKIQRKNKNPWFDDECKDAVLRRRKGKETW